MGVHLGRVIAALWLGAFLAGCGGASSGGAIPAPSSSTATPTPALGAASVRVLYTSLYGIDVSQGVARGTSLPPDESKNIVDVYTYPVGAQRNVVAGTAIAYGASVPTSQPYPAGTYQIDVFPHNLFTTPVLSEMTTLLPGERLTVVIRGMTQSAQLLNFIEPTPIAGQTSIALHAASDITAMGFGFLPPNVFVNRFGPLIPQAALLTEQPSSGPATPGNVNGGEYLLTPFTTAPATLLGIGFGDTTGSAQPQVNLVGAVSIANIFPQFSNGIPSGTHLSLFVVDSFSPDNCCRWSFVGFQDP